MAKAKSEIISIKFPKTPMEVIRKDVEKQCLEALAKGEEINDEPDPHYYPAIPIEISTRVDKKTYKFSGHFKLVPDTDNEPELVLSLDFNFPVMFSQRVADRWMEENHEEIITAIQIYVELMNKENFEADDSD